MSETISTPQTGPSVNPPQSPLAVPLAIVIAGALVAGAIIFSDKTGAVPQPSAATGDGSGAEVSGADKEEALKILAIRENDHVLGNRNAEIVFVEYSDPECPFCKRFHETMKQVMAEYGKDGKTAWVYRHFPLSIHPKAPKEAEAMECAAELGGQDGFWKFADRIFEITPANNGLDPAELPKIAQYAGIDSAAFEACLASGKMAARVQTDFSDGVNIGIRGTPHTVILNTKTGKTVPIGGALPFENVRTLYESIRK